MKINLQLLTDLGNEIMSVECPDVQAALIAMERFQQMEAAQVVKLECKVCNARFENVPDYDNGNVLVDEDEHTKIYEFMCDECKALADTEKTDEAAATGN